jgi:CubicO group peptidase (beta-lactamase class C family)
MKTMKRHAAGVLLALAVSTAPVAYAAPARAQAAAAATETLEQTVDRVAADLIAKKETAGFAIGITQRGKAPLIKGYGFANLEDRVPATGHTVFRVGSITKEFTAAAVLLLAEQGKLSIDDTLAKYFPSFPRANEVTLRQLLNHTSGIHNYTAIDGFLPTESRLVLSDAGWETYMAGAKPLYDFDPGTGWRYSNSGFLLLGMIVEKASGQKLAQALRSLLFDPLGLNDTRLDELAEIVPSRAQGYDKAPTSATGFANTAPIAMEAASGAGAIRSTAGDLLKWHAALLDGKLLKPASLKLMLEPGRLKDGKLASSTRPSTGAAVSAPPSDYGFGISTSVQKGRRTVGHGGAINGFNASLMTYPDQQVTIVILANTLPAAGAVSAAMTDPIFTAIGAPAKDK